MDKGRRWRECRDLKGWMVNLLESFQLSTIRFLKDERMADANLCAVRVEVLVWGAESEEVLLVSGAKI